MSDEVQRVEVITSVQRRRRWSVAEKIRLIEETLQPGMSVSFVARKHGLSPSLLFNWRRRMAEGGREAVRVDDEVIGAARVRQLEERTELQMGTISLQRGEHPARQRHGLPSCDCRPKSPQVLDRGLECLDG
jgi:transposase-like protein